MHIPDERLRCVDSSYQLQNNSDGTIVQAQTPAPLMTHSTALPSVVAYVMFDKSFVRVSYYRQEACIAQLRMELPRETMANWYIKCAMKYFHPIYGCLHRFLLQREVIHADETTSQVLRKKGKDADSTSYMRIYLIGSDSLLHPSRSL